MRGLRVWILFAFCVGAAHAQTSDDAPVAQTTCAAFLSKTDDEGKKRLMAFWSGIIRAEFHREEAIETLLNVGEMFDEVKRQCGLGPTAPLERVATLVFELAKQGAFHPPAK
jgi:hypothetical protein